MVWSTREIADLSGTTVNTVRHYHHEGLLDEPDRMSNGYKQYQVRHLVRLLQIRRLRDLGVPLHRIEQVGSDGGGSSTALVAIDADLSASIERLQRARAEITAMLRDSTVTDVRSGLGDVASNLSAAERSMILIYSQFYDEDATADLRDILESEKDDVRLDFDDLAPDAGEDTRRQLAERCAIGLAQVLTDYPWLRNPSGHMTKSPQIAGDTFAESVAAPFNPAQVDVLGRAEVLANQQLNDRDV